MTTALESMQEEISSLAVSYETLGQDAHQSNPPVLPSVLFYRTGIALFHESARLHASSPSENACAKKLARAFAHLLESIPSPVLRGIMDDINGAFVSLVSGESLKDSLSTTIVVQDENEGGETASEAILEGLESLCGIYSSSPRACRVGFSSELCGTLNVVYQQGMFHEGSRVRRCRQGNNGLETPDFPSCLCELASCLLVHGMILGDNLGEGAEEEERRQLLMNRIIQTFSDLGGTTDSDEGGGRNFIGDVEIHNQQRSHSISSEIGANSMSMRDGILLAFPIQSPERDYILDMLSSFVASARKVASEQVAAAASSTSGEKNVLAGTATRTDKIGDRFGTATFGKEDRMKMLVEQVSQVLPHLGEGYIETALACYDLDPEKTVQHLLQKDALHPRLRALDPNLPRRKHRHAADCEEEISRDEEARERQKKLIREMEVQAENQAYLLSQMEYNDDYDDQYDDLGDLHVNAVDEGTYDTVEVSFARGDRGEGIKLYNRVMKEEEMDAAFWEENRNVNRQQKVGQVKSKNKVEEDAEDTNDDYGEQENEVRKWGPDKAKGGRVIGPDGKYVTNKRKGKGGPNVADASGWEGAMGRGGNSGRGRGRGRGGQKQGSGFCGRGAGNGQLGGGAGPSASSDKQTKVQRRRKNDNKSKIANHHRKERALKKAGGPVTGLC